jgi:membrane-associated phospholipid phosphatase
MLKRDWFGNTFRERIPLVVFLLAWQCWYFLINQYLQDKGGFVADLDAIDGNMPLLPIFVVPYVMGLSMMPIFTLFAAWKFPRDLFQRYAIAFFTIMCVGYTLWLIFPAYVLKEPIQGSGFFTDLLKRLHSGDDSYGNHNAIPSSHVYYVTIAICYYILWKRKLFIPGIIFATLNALSTMFTHQHYFLDVIAGWVQTVVVYYLAERILVPYVRGLEKQRGFFAERLWQPKRGDSMIAPQSDAVGD